MEWRAAARPWPGSTTRTLQHQRCRGRFGLAEVAGRRAGDPSGGQTRRLAVALAVAGRPWMVGLDEPTTGSRTAEVAVGHGERRCVEGSDGMQASNDRRATRPGPAGPGPVGLLIRVVLGAASVYALVELVSKWDILRDLNLIESDFWFITVFTVCLLADVFNIGLRRRWGLWPIVVFLAGAGVIGSAGYLAAGEVWTTALAAWVYAGDLLVFGALSVAFPVAIATHPGMRVQRAAEAGRAAARHGR